ncbi:hypothetical protein [Paenibacillus polymyxa]|uniref:hypothetical protein n=1 Tax=Paenibacillus polymyxa TaxID=1406 RepID=UPI000C9FB3A4|nr:hypothetical protein [Paenibacillus polymyxa]PNQ85072.1 hypothetical protein C1T20_13855 [Paenibacillus polymyxa]
MADYSFSRFNSEDFEHFIQSLSKKILGNGTITFGDGPDGGREATFNGVGSFPNLTEKWSGYWVIQAKYRSRAEEKGDDYTWVKKISKMKWKNLK